MHPSPWSSASSRPQISPRQALRRREGPGPVTASLRDVASWPLIKPQGHVVAIITGALRFHGKLFLFCPCFSLSLSSG